MHLLTIPRRLTPAVGVGLAVALLAPAVSSAATVSAPALLPGPASAVALSAADRPVVTVNQGTSASVFSAGVTTPFAADAFGDLVVAKTPFTDVRRSAAAADGSVALAAVTRADAARRGGVLTNAGAVLAPTGDVDEYTNTLGDIAWIRTTSDGGTPEATTVVQRRRAGSAALSAPVTFPVPTRDTLSSSGRTTSRWVVDVDGSVLTGTGSGVLRAGPTDTAATSAVTAPAIADAFPIGSASGGTVAFTTTTTGLTPVGQPLIARVHVRRGLNASWETIDLAAIAAQRLPGLASATNRRSFGVDQVVVGTTGETVIAYNARAGTGTQADPTINGVIVVPATGTAFTTGEADTDTILSDGTVLAAGDDAGNVRIRPSGATTFGPVLHAGVDVAPGNAAAAAWMPLTVADSVYREVDATGIHNSPSAAASGFTGGSDIYRSPDGRWAVAADDTGVWRRSPSGMWERTTVLTAPPAGTSTDAITIDNNGVAAFAYSQSAPGDGVTVDPPNINPRLVLIGGPATIPGTTPPTDPGPGTDPGTNPGGGSPPSGGGAPAGSAPPGGTTTTPGGTTAPPAGGAPTSAAKPATPKPAAASLSARRTIALARRATRTFTVRVSCTAACKLTGRLTVGTKRIATVTARRTTAGTATLRVKLTTSARRRLLKAGRATLRVVDSRGAKRTVTVRVR